MKNTKIKNQIRLMPALELRLSRIKFDFKKKISTKNQRSKTKIKNQNPETRQRFVVVVTIKAGSIDEACKLVKSMEHSA